MINRHNLHKTRWWWQWWWRWHVKEEDINNTTTNHTTNIEFEHMDSTEVLPVRDTHYQGYSFGTTTTLSYYEQMTDMNPTTQGVE